MEAVEQGVMIADRFGGTIHFLNVVDVGTEMSASGVGHIADELSKSLEQMADDALTDAESRAEDADVPYERTILEGLPHEATVEYSDGHDIDLIVMGATGQSGIKEHLLGSTTDRVTQSVDSSVLIARP
ncbi:universal stress protein [Halobacterium noricense]|uniref:Universal stress protein n=2 Tax=Haladaptatus pallidirubidus TaxID=1008152 RepID=A0AAV3UQA9_9EURY